MLKDTVARAGGIWLQKWGEEEVRRAGGRERVQAGFEHPKKSPLPNLSCCNMEPNQLLDVTVRPLKSQQTSSLQIKILTTKDEL